MRVTVNVDSLGGGGVEGESSLDISNVAFLSLDVTWYEWNLDLLGVPKLGWF